MSQSLHYGHPLSFPKYSNQGWEPMLHFSNGGLSVNLLKWNRHRQSKTRNMLEAYAQFDGVQIQAPESSPQLGEGSSISKE